MNRLVIGILGLLLFFGMARAGSNVGYLRDLDAKPVATESDLVCVVAMFLGEAREGHETDKARAFLDQKGLLKSPFKYRPEKKLELGQASFLIARAMNLKGGWAARVFGMSHRTAYKELLSRGYVRPFGAHSPVSGTDLLGIIRLITADRRRGHL